MNISCHSKEMKILPNVKVILNYDAYSTYRASLTVLDLTEFFENSRFEST